MTKAEMAEWLAENVLEGKKIGWFKEATCWDKNGWKIGDNEFYSASIPLEQFIYSPAGFFAVWDALVKKQIRFRIRYYTVSDVYEVKIELKFKADSKDRYEAFYNAVYEAMKEGK